MERCAAFTCVLGDVVEQQRVLCESQHLHGNDVLQLQPATQTISLSCLRNSKKNGSRCCSHTRFLNGRRVCGHSDLHEKGEPLVFLLLTLDELQCRRQVTAESSYGALYLLLFLTAKLEEAANNEPQVSAFSHHHRDLTGIKIYPERDY